MTFGVRGIALPERQERTFTIDGETLRLDPSSSAELISDGGWILPGLVDVHTHPGTEQLPSTAEAFDDEVLRRQLIEHRDAGVLLVRTPGTAARMPAWIEEAPDLPRVRSAGRWLATPDRFFPGYGRDIAEAELVRAAVEESASTGPGGWCKIIGDWMPEAPPVPSDLLAEAVAAVHARGGKVAVHCQTAEGCRNAVLAGADSLEHGMHLDPALLDRMASQGTAMVPTLTAFGEVVDRLRAREPSVRRDWILIGWEGMLPMVRAAHEAGVTVLAGTDSAPFGNVATEAAWLVKAGVPAEQALGAASWTARSWLGLPGLADGAPADLVVYDADPVAEPATLAHPRRIILRGRVIV
ncbi:MAG TPA: amidohydrolase family protein [Actinocrinis sp.]|jgi:imidazolonepropionase-like amidohydrolase